MFRITLTVLNPMTGESRVISYQFDPDTITQQKWNGAYVPVKALIDELVVAAPDSEPPTW